MFISVRLSFSLWRCSEVHRKAEILASVKLHSRERGLKTMLQWWCVLCITAACRTGKSASWPSAHTCLHAPFAALTSALLPCPLCDPWHSSRAWSCEDPFLQVSFGEAEQGTQLRIRGGTYAHKSASHGTLQTCTTSSPKTETWKLHLTQYSSEKAKEDFSSTLEVKLTTTTATTACCISSIYNALVVSTALNFIFSSYFHIVVARCLFFL